MRSPILLIIMILVTSISGWITAGRMRRRIRRTIGGKVSDIELTSLNTWMKVDEAEKQGRSSER